MSDDANRPSDDEVLAHLDFVTEHLDVRKVRGVIKGMLVATDEETAALIEPHLRPANTTIRPLGDGWWEVRIGPEVLGTFHERALL